MLIVRLVCVYIYLYEYYTCDIKKIEMESSPMKKSRNFLFLDV